MSENNAKFDLISQMVQETFDLAEEQTAFDNILPFENSKTEINEYILVHDTNKHCFTLEIDNQLIEIPENWGAFEKLCTQPSEGLELNTISDSHHILEIFAAVIGQPIEMMSITSKGSYFKAQFTKKSFQQNLRHIA